MDLSPPDSRSSLWGRSHEHVRGRAVPGRAGVGQAEAAISAPQGPAPRTWAGLSLFLASV